MFRKEETPLYNAFMSPRNVQKIQYSLQDHVADHTGWRPGQQDEIVLRSVMEAVFHENALGWVVTDEEIHHMNKVVIDRLVPQIINGAQAYTQYLEDSRPRLGQAGFPTQPRPIATKKWRSYI